MKFFILAFIVAAAAALPIPDDSGPIDVVVNGVPDGEALDIGHIVGIKLQEHADGQLVAATDVLHPYTFVGIAEIAAAAEATAPQPESVPAIIPQPALPPTLPEIVPAPITLPETGLPMPQPVVLPEPATPEFIQVVPEPVVLPEPAVPEQMDSILPEPVVLPQPVAPEQLPEPVVLPAPVAPEVSMPEVIAPIISPEAIEESEPLPVPAPQNDLYNDGIVQISVNQNQGSDIMSTLQSWFNMVVNYIGNGGSVQSTTVV